MLTEYDDLEPRVDSAHAGPLLLVAEQRDRRRNWPNWERTILLAGAVGISLGVFLAIDPRQPWPLVLALVLAGLGTDGIIRSHPSLQPAGPADTAPFLFAPVLFVLATGLFLQDSVTSYWAWPTAIAAAALFGAIVCWEYITVNPAVAVSSAAYFFLNIITYLMAFALFAFSYEFEVEVVPSALIVGTVGFLMAVELLRESWIFPLRTLTYSAAIGLVLAEARGLLVFLPLDDIPASIFLLLTFYLATELVLRYFRGIFRWATVAEFTLVGIAGLLLLTLGPWFQG